jgi:hypothetical protein
MNSSELIEAIEKDRSSSHWLIEQVRQISKRDIIDQIRDVETLKEVLELQWDEDIERISNEMLGKSISE